MSTDRRELDEKTDVSPGEGRGVTAHTPHLEEFDREIHVRSILWTGLALTALALVVHLLMWWLLRGFSSFDEKRDVRLTPIEAANPQQPPPEPRLQISPNDDMAAMREEEDRLLAHAGWVDRRQGTVRLPIDAAMDAILSRGVSAAQPASPANPSPPQPSSPQGRGGSNADPSRGQVPPGSPQ